MKLEEIFSNSQYIIDNEMTPYRCNRSKHGGDLLVYAKEGFSAKNLQAISAKINLKRQKWLLLCLYRSPSQQQAYPFGEIAKSLNFASYKLKNFLLMVDQSCEMDDNTLSLAITTPIF